MSTVLTILISWTAISVVATVPLARALTAGSAAGHELVPLRPADERAAA